MYVCKYARKILDGKERLAVEMHKVFYLLFDIFLVYLCYIIASLFLLRTVKPVYSEHTL